MIEITDPQSQSTLSSSIVSPPSVDNGQLGGQEDNQRVLARQNSTGVSRGVQQIGGPNVYVDSGNEQIVVEDNSVPTVLMGKQPNFGLGFYVSSGKDVTTITNGDDFIFNSNQDIFKIVTTGQATIPSIAFTAAAGQYNVINSTTVTLAHGLGYIPAFIAFENGGGLTYSIVGKPQIWSGGGTTGFTETWISVATDATNVYLFATAFGFNDSRTVGSWSVKYYLLQETAN